MSKKKMAVMLEEKQFFIEGKTAEDGTVEIAGCLRNGIPREAAEEIYNQMISFAEYAFNKSHAAAYAVLAYETAYLKTHYPVEFMAALMTSVMGDASSTANYIHNCRKMGIEVLPPDINESSEKFTVVYDPEDTARENGRIRFGLLGVKNLGKGAIEAIIEARQEKGKPADIFRFIENLDIHRVNRKGIESLIRAGALDCLNPNRAAHLVIYESLLDAAQSDAKHNIAGQLSLFQTNAEAMEEGGHHRDLPDVANFSQDELIAQEKEMLGVYITAHPLEEYSETISRMVTVTSRQLAQVLDDESEGVMSGPAGMPGMPGGGNPQAGGAEGGFGYGGASAPGSRSGVTDGMTATMAGIVIGRKTLITKNNKMMAFVDLEDLYGNVEVVVFPNVYEKYGSLLEEDRIVAITGSINFKEGEVPKLLADRVVDLREVRDITGDQPLHEGALGTMGAPGASYGSGAPGLHGTPGAPRAPDVQPEGLIKIRLPEGPPVMIRDVLRQIRRIMTQHSGRYQAIVYLPPDPGRPRGSTFRTTPDLWVDPGEQFRTRIIRVVGEETYKA